ncbi:MAG: type VI secretion system protein [Oceanibaculum nanhaiense]|uniref:type VI secretion system protein n=1 Tax=Oceanibaculum nanhaiense TaxID=1909734 RepID=UPI0025A4BBE4|nr:type VI secretion system protein [Oceanibaculum nanhaiense]MDM7947459.1 type VI secretion system protein [Oceanibaculum nanhaiense]
MAAQFLVYLKDMPGWAWAVLGLLLVVLAGGALWWWLTHRKQPDSATTTTDKALAALKQAVPQAAARAGLPWVARIGPELPGLAGIPGMEPAFVEPAEVPKDGVMRWWGVPGGVIIDLPWAAESFDAALKALVAARPERPLDAVLLTVPAAVLDADPTLATTLRARLMDACRESGMRLPIYLLLDGAEGLAGFSEVALALPEVRRADMLGWSVPVGIAAPYDPAWPGTALRETAIALGDTVAALFGADDALPDPEAAYRLPERISALAGPASALAGTIFAAGVQPTPYGLRGLYLAGTVQGVRFFLADLLRRKIFAETGLAVPLSGHAPRQGWQVRALRAVTVAVAVVGLAGMIWSAVGLGRAATDMAGIVTQLRNDLIQIDRQSSVGQPPDRDTLTGMVQRLVAALDAAQSDRLRYAFLPVSWFDPLSPALSDAAEQGFGRIVLAAIRAGLAAEAQALADPATPLSVPRPAAEAKGFPSLQDYLAVSAYVDEVAAFEAQLALYDGLAGPDRAQNLSTLMKEVLSVDLDPAIVTARPPLMAGLAAARQAAGNFPLAPYRPGVRTRLDGLMSVFLQTDYAGNVLQAALMPVAADMAAIAGPAQTGKPAALDRLQSGLDGATALIASGTAAYLALDPSLAALATALDTLYAQPFMAARQARKLPASLTEGSAAFWDPAPLAEAKAAATAYAGTAKPPVGIAAPLSSEVAALMALRASAAIEDRLAGSLAQRAPAGKTLPELQTEASAFSAVAADLEAVLTALTTGRLLPLRLDLGAILRDQADSLLARTDALQAANADYATVDGDAFGWWDGKAALGYRGFGLDSQAAMQALLTRNQEYIGLLSGQLAGPVLDFLGKAGSALPPGDAQALEAKWAGIAAALAAMAAKQPTATMAVLNGFILETMPAITLSTCASAITPAMLAASPADYFDARRLALMRGISDRCTALAQSDVAAGYAALVTQFRTRVEGKYPFAEADRLQEATEADLLAVLRAYDALPANAAEVLRGQGEGDAAGFVASIGQVRALFPSFDGSAPPGLGLLLTPRSNRTYERGGNQLIDWRIAVGDETLAGVPAAPAPLVWESGDAVTITLRIAANGPLSPAPAGQQPAASVSGEAVTYSFGGSWAAFRAWQAQRGTAADFPPGSPALDTSWRFVIATQNTQAAAGEAVRVYASAVPFAPADKTRAPMALPAFPTSAPDLKTGGSQ